MAKKKLRDLPSAYKPKKSDGKKFPGVSTRTKKVSNQVGKTKTVKSGSSSSGTSSYLRPTNHGVLTGASGKKKK